MQEDVIITNPYKVELMKKIVTAGQGKMKPIKSVSGKAADDVVAYMRTLKK